MKMTKIESARIIVKQRGICYKYNHSETIRCDDCFNGWDRKKCVDFTDEETLALAKAYIKRHESKSKKKDHILDTTKKVEEPKPIKTVGIDNSDVTLALTAKHEPTPLQIAKMIRDNGYKCIYKNFDDCRVCPFISAGCGSMEDDAPQESKDRRKQLIDDYISANEPVKDCPVNSEYPDPIRVDIPDIFYCPTPHGILRFKRSHIILKDTNNEDCLLKYRDEYSCYRTLEEAVIVAKKLWGSK